MQKETERPDSGEAAPGIPEQAAISSQKLFRGEREIVIAHDGQRYQLSITRQNKLILTK